MNNPVVMRGRASKSNASSRYDAQAREGFDDGWSEDENQPERLETTLITENAKSILSRNDSPDIGFDRSINPYRGCEHGCIYCYARPSHAYLGHSPGLDFETKLYFKPEAAKLLERELSVPGYRPLRVQLGANTDPYQPIEKRLLITRQVLEVLSRYNHPVSITTKSALVTRDIDILGPMAERGLAMVAVSITTLDRKLARRMEPRASTPDLRFDAIRKLSAAGIPVWAGVAPVIPALTDHEMEAIMERAAEAGATSAYYSVLRLSWELKDLFREWLAAEFPDRAAHVMSLVNQMRDGKDNDSRFGLRMVGEGPIADLIQARFRAAKRRLNLARKIGPLETKLFAVPPKAGDQLSLF
jgi:DNA repair photolyase